MNVNGDVRCGHEPGESTDDLGADDEGRMPRTNDDPDPRRNDNDDHNDAATQDGVDDGGGDSQLLFSCQCDSARSVATLLSCLRRVVTSGSGPSWSGAATVGGGGTRGGGGAPQTPGTQSTAAAVGLAEGSAGRIQHATVYAGPGGLTFHVRHGLARQSQCSVDLPRGLFREYFVGEEEVWMDEGDVEGTNGQEGAQQSPSRGGGGTKEIVRGGEFGVNLTTVLECFSILSKNKAAAQSTVPAGNGPGGSAAGGGGTKPHVGEFAALSGVPLCMSYDRGTATFHLEFLEGGALGRGGDAAANVSGGCLVTCEVPGVSVADDIDDGPDDDDNAATDQRDAEDSSGLPGAFRSSPLLSRAILYSDALQSAVAELYDVPGASIVTIALSRKGMELGTIGPRSEVWVNVPYHRGQGGLYVGLECYDPDGGNTEREAATSALKEDTIVRRYPLGAFLSGMRGLDIGVETCVSVNARGMMAIQHQVSREGCCNYAEGNGDENVKPSFVDFIMTCIKEEVDEADSNDEGIFQGDADEMRRQQQRNGLHDITNDDRYANVDEQRRKAKARAGGGRVRAAQREEYLEEANDCPVRNGQNGKQDDSVESEEEVDCAASVDLSENQQHGAAKAEENSDKLIKKMPSSNDTSRILEELELDQDIVSLRRRGGASQGRKNALEDIRRRRREQQQRQSFEHQNKNEMQKGHEQSNYDDYDCDDYDNNANHDKKRIYSGDRKRRYGTSRSKTSRKGARCSSKRDNCNISESKSNEDDSDETNSCSEYLKSHHANPVQDSQSQSQSEEDDDGDGDETEHEDLDVTAEIPRLFSRRSSLSTSRHGGLCLDSSRRREGRIAGNDSDCNKEEAEREPRMMYGDTKLEFTQDGYGSDGSF